jgi:proteasome accessory factor C
MRLTLSELRALELGLAMLRAERAPDEHAAIDRATEKLRKVIAKLPKDPIPDDETRHASLGAGMRAVSNEHLASVRTALRAHKKLRLEYRRANASDAKSRIVRPYALVASTGMLYLIAHCETSDGLRIFRLDRVEGAAVLDESFTVPESFSIDEVLRDGRALQGEGPGILRIRYSPRIARWIAEREGVALDTDGSVTVEHPLADVEWAVRHVLQYGPEAEVLSPDEVRTAVRQKLEGMAAVAGAAASR